MELVGISSRGLLLSGHLGVMARHGKMLSYRRSSLRLGKDHEACSNLVVHSLVLQIHIRISLAAVAQMHRFALCMRVMRENFALHTRFCLS